MNSSRLNLKNVHTNPFTLGILLIVIVLAISLQRYLLPEKVFVPGGNAYTQYNNYVIFKQSFHHLVEGNDLYKLYPEEHWDLYKYSPTFALLMAPLAILPDFPGLFAWNLLNVLLLFFALKKLPVKSDKSFLLMMAFIALEMFNATQSSQSNCLITAMLILAFLSMERSNLLISTLLIVGTVFIKIFGIVAFALFLFYPGKKKAILFSLGWTILFLALPLVACSPSGLLAQYQSWFHLLAYDHSTWDGLSVSGLISRWFAVDVKNITLLLGATFFLLPLLRIDEFRKPGYRMNFLASILIWIVIFNHRAESATFIIAVTGVAIWYFTQKRNWLNTSLLILCFVLTILSPTDIFPKVLRENYVAPYALKALPCILIWIKIQTEMLMVKPLPSDI